MEMSIVVNLFKILTFSGGTLDLFGGMYVCAVATPGAELSCQSGTSKLATGKAEMGQHEVRRIMSNWSRQQVKHLDS